MNSLRSVLNRLSDDDYELVKSNQSIYSLSFESPESIEAGKSYIASLNKDMDVVCPVMQSGWRQTDIETMSMSNDQRLINSIAGNLSSSHIQSMSTEGLTDEQVADSSIPRNLDMSDLERLQDSIVPDTLVSPVPSVEPSKTD